MSIIPIVFIAACYLIGIVCLAYGVAGLKDNRYEERFNVYALFKDNKITPPGNIILISIIVIISTTLFLYLYLKKVGAG